MMQISYRLLVIFFMSSAGTCQFSIWVYMGLACIIFVWLIWLGLAQLAHERTKSAQLGVIG